MKSKGTRVDTFTCKYSSGHLIPIIQSCQDELGVKSPPRTYAGVGDCGGLDIIIMYYIDHVIACNPIRYDVIICARVFVL